MRIIENIRQKQNPKHPLINHKLRSKYPSKKTRSHTQKESEKIENSMYNKKEQTDMFHAYIIKNPKNRTQHAGFQKTLQNPYKTNRKYDTYLKGITKMYSEYLLFVKNSRNLKEKYQETRKINKH